MTRTCLTLALALGLTTAWTTNAEADTIVTVEDATVTTTATSGASTTLDVYVDRTGADDGTPLTGVLNFQVRVELTGPTAGTDAQIVGVSARPSSAATHPQAHPLDSTNLVSSTEAFANTFNLGSVFPIADGDGLMEIEVEVNSGVVGTWNVEVLAATASDTDFSDAGGTPLPFTAGSGTLTAVPEPATAALLLTGGSLMLTRRRRSQ
jgi:hypothetical protein